MSPGCASPAGATAGNGDKTEPGNSRDERLRVSNAPRPTPPLHPRHIITLTPQPASLLLAAVGVVPGRPAGETFSCF